MKKLLVCLLVIIILYIGFLFIRLRTVKQTNVPVIIIDTDAGTDDAEAILLSKYFDLNTIGLIATGGNSSNETVVKNTIILNKYSKLNKMVVKGYEIKLSQENNTFHGEDGLANISDRLVSKLKIKIDDINNAISLTKFKLLIKNYENIIYIGIGPITTIAEFISDDEIKSKIKKIYLMGGGLNEFNCSHDTEFNFSKNPEAVKKVLSSGMDIVLFPLDLTNYQRVTKNQIDELEKISRYPEYITFLRYNLKSNKEFNNVDAAILHDTMPIIYTKYPEKFVTENVKIISDEYGHIEKNENGYNVTIATAIEEGVMLEYLTKALSK